MSGRLVLRVYLHLQPWPVSVLHLSKTDVLFVLCVYGCLHSMYNFVKFKIQRL